MGKFQKSDSADTCGGKFPLVSMGGRAEGLACADPGARTPIGATGNFQYSFYFISSNKESFRVKSKINSAWCILFCALLIQYFGYFYSHIVVKIVINPKILSIICVYLSLNLKHYYSVLVVKEVSNCQWEK